MSQLTALTGQHPPGVDKDGNVWCKHGLAFKTISGSAANPNREYYCCPKHRFDDPDRCSFFKWANEVEQIKASLSAASQSRGAMGLQSPRTPRPSQQQRASAARSPQSVSSSSTLKRSRSASPSPHEEPPVTPHRNRYAMPITPQSRRTPSSAFTPSQRQSRLAAIQGALAQTLEPTQQSVAGQGELNAPPTLSHSFSTETLLGDERVNQFLRSLHDSSADQPLSSQMQGVSGDVLPPSQKRRRTTAAVANVGPSPSPLEVEVFDMAVQTDPVSDDDEETENEFWAPGGTSPPTAGPSASYRLPDIPLEERAPRAPGPSLSPRAHSFGGSPRSGLLTPPRSSQPQPVQEFAHSATQPGTAQPETPTRSKGKGREIGGTASQWQNIQGDVSHPFHERAAALHAESQSLTVRRDLEVMPSEGFAGSPSVDSFSAAVKELEGLPEYIRKLDRKLAAATKSVQMKTNRITELDGQIQKLQAINRALEESVVALSLRR